MTLTPLLLVGASGHARSLLALLHRHGGFQLVGLIDSFQPPGILVHGLPILGGEADVPRICGSHGVRHFLVAIGDNARRQAMAERLQVRIPDLVFPTIVDPTAVIAADSQLGSGVVVMPQAHVGPGCVLKAGSLLNTQSSLDHDCSLGAFASLAPGSITGGGVRVGDRSFLGLGARVIHSVTIGRDTVIGAGSLVLQDFPDCSVAYGSPARLISSRRADEAYL